MLLKCEIRKIGEANDEFPHDFISTSRLIAISLYNESIYHQTF